MWRLWRFRPRPLWPPRKWPRQYYAWRLETYAGIPASEVTWRTLVRFFLHPQHRRAFCSYLRWLRHMQQIRRLQGPRRRSDARHHRHIRH